MRPIIYITTAMDEIDFKEYIPHWTYAPNPSNQNFHNKLIRCLALTHKVDVISIRPFSRKLVGMNKLESETKIDGNIKWHYLEIKRNPLTKLLNCQKEMNKVLSSVLEKDSLIFTDTINAGVTHFLKHSVKRNRKNVKIIGVVTDSPSNISGVGRSYTKYILDNARTYDGYISLTKELDELYNVNHKPSMIVEGLVEERDIPTLDIDEDKKYFFFGGALMQRYGIYNLIEAFKQFSKEFSDYHLLIAGHHADEEKLLNTIGNSHNILYLKMIPVEEVLYLEKYAVANINPRPYSEDLDRYSIPSKTIEYLVSGQITICVKNTKLYKYFPEEILWAKSASVEDLKEALIKVATSSKEFRRSFAERGKEKALSLFSLRAVNKRIDEELIDIIN